MWVVAGVAVVAVGAGGGVGAGVGVGAVGAVVAGVAVFNIFAFCICHIFIIKLVNLINNPVLSYLYCGVNSSKALSLLPF